MKAEHMITIGEMIEEHRKDPEFRREWDRGAFAREVAIRIIRYRAEESLTLEQLATLVGMSPSALTDLEIGEETPSLETLAQVSASTGIDFRVDVHDGEIALA
jgi:DNA-binding XRE family transcriptional regulator